MQTLLASLKKVGIIKGIGETRDPKEPLIKDLSDIDLFVLCDEIPSPEKREVIYGELMQYNIQMNLANGGVWGYGDGFMVDGISVMPMYFTITEMEKYLKRVLNGKVLDKQNGFYPTGRLSTIQKMHVLFEKNQCYQKLIDLVMNPHDSLFKVLFEKNIQACLDEEGLTKARLREDVLYYHQILEESIDCFLMALFALNKTYFPSRKRTKSYIASFLMKPKDCYSRLIEMIQKGSNMKTINQSIQILKDLVLETKDLRAKNATF